MHIQVSKGVDGLFLKRADVDELGLDYLEDDVETCYGPLRRLSPVILLTTHHLTPVLHYFLVNNVYEMPAGFENSEVYGGGVVSLSLVLSLGVSVAFDRGTVYLVDPQAGSDLVGWDVVGSRAEVTVAPPKGGAFNSGGKEDGDAAEATGTLLVRSEIEEFDDGDEDDEY
ncbi:hypothetical protein DFJ73DRAFT_821540 [Zopfochytrium polystomum]|nr:hypothetical protein DFJ73DRAFT_821540 [Zopfochytrium polystomum]